MDDRFKQMGRGEIAEGAFQRRSVVTDEYRSIADKLNGKNNTVDAGTLLLNRISEGRKVGECALVACHNDTGEALGITGNTDMKTCFDYIIYMGGLVDSNRTQKCPPEIKQAALKRDRPAVAWLTEKNQWFVLDDDLPMPKVSNNPPIQEGGMNVPVRDIGFNTSAITRYAVSNTSIPVQHIDSMTLDEKIKALHEKQVSFNKIAAILDLKGSKQQRNARIKQALGIPETTELIEPE